MKKMFVFLQRIPYVDPILGRLTIKDRRSLKLICLYVRKNHIYIRHLVLFL